MRPVCVKHGVWEAEEREGAGKGGKGRGRLFRSRGPGVCVCGGGLHARGLSTFLVRGKAEEREGEGGRGRGRERQKKGRQRRGRAGEGADCSVLKGGGGGLQSARGLSTFLMREGRGAGVRNGRQMAAVCLLRCFASGLCVRLSLRGLPLRPLPTRLAPWEHPASLDPRVCSSSSTDYPALCPASPLHPPPPCLL